MIDFNDCTYIENNKKQYTPEEIVEMFLNDKTLSDEFKSTVMCKLDAWLQAMYNVVEQREKTMKMFDAHGDMWQEHHNEFVSLFQKYNP